MTRIFTVGKVDITEVRLERIEIGASPTGGAMEGTAYLVLKTSAPGLHFPPIRMTFIPKQEFLEEILHEALVSIGLGQKKTILPSE